MAVNRHATATLTPRLPSFNFAWFEFDYDPLLFISVLYANALIGQTWITFPPINTTIFYGESEMNARTIEMQILESGLYIDMVNEIEYGQQLRLAWATLRYICPNRP